MRNIPGSLWAKLSETEQFHLILSPPADTRYRTAIASFIQDVLKKAREIYMDQAHAPMNEVSGNGQDRVMNDV